jgi:hypothetical protein
VETLLLVVVTTLVVVVVLAQLGETHRLTVALWVVSAVRVDSLALLVHQSSVAVAVEPCTFQVAALVVLVVAVTQKFHLLAVLVA